MDKSGFFNTMKEVMMDDTPPAAAASAVVVKTRPRGPGLAERTYGTLDERLAEGHDIDEDEQELMQRALEENSVIVAQMTPFFDKNDA